MAAFDSDAFSTDAFDSDAFDFGEDAQQDDSSTQDLVRTGTSYVKLGASYVSNLVKTIVRRY